MDFADPWNFEEDYGKLLDFARGFPRDSKAQDHIVHITTGTHVAQRRLRKDQPTARSALSFSLVPLIIARI